MSGPEFRGRGGTRYVIETGPGRRVFTTSVLVVLLAIQEDGFNCHFGFGTISHSGKVGVSDSPVVGG